MPVPVKTQWLCNFSAVRLGAIGMHSVFTVVVEAENRDAARLKLYDTHEHICSFRACRVFDTFEQARDWGDAHMREYPARRVTQTQWGYVVEKSPA